MLHTKFQGHWSIGSGEEDFLRFFTIYGHGGHLGQVTQLICIKFQGHPSIGSGEEDFLKLLPYMGMAAILVM